MTASTDLLVTVPDTRLAERRYILDLVLRDWLGCTYALDVHRAPVVELRAAGMPEAPALTMPDRLLSVADSDWLTERSMPVSPLRRVQIGPQDMPVLFGDDGPASPWSTTPEGTHLGVDVLGTAFFLVTAYEQTTSSVRDRHGRFPASASLAVREGFLRRPLVDESVELLRSGMRTLWPHLTRTPEPFGLALTHDVDQPWGALGRSTANVARSLVADLLVRHDPVLAGRRLRGLVDARRGRVDRDPVNTFDFLMEVSEQHDLRSTFYFLAGNLPGEPDFRYRITDRPILDLVRRIHDRGHRIGLHASYVSHGSAERTALELRALQSACDGLGFQEAAWGVRQHYLRFDPLHTWRIHEATGLEHDSTLGFADRIGFRAGTTRAFDVFDLVQRRSLRVRERPLLAMDVSLFEGMGLGIEAGMAEVKDVVGRASPNGGEAVLLFHNNWPVGARRQREYRELITHLAGPH